MCLDPQPANVLVAVGFALSPGLVFSRFRQNVVRGVVRH
jgi:hypothetical protein